MSVDMKVRFDGTADDVLRRLTDEQIAEGIKRAKDRLAIHQFLSEPEDPWAYHNNSGPFAPSKTGEILAREPDGSLARGFEKALNMLTAEQQRRVGL